MILDQMQRPACMHCCFFDTKRRTFLLSYLCSQLTHESAKRQTLLTQNKHFQTLKEDVNYLSKFKIKTKNVNFENKFTFLWTANSCGRDFATGRRIPGNFIHCFCLSCIKINTKIDIQKSKLKIRLMCNIFRTKKIIGICVFNSHLFNWFLKYLNFITTFFHMIIDTFSKKILTVFE